MGQAGPDRAGIPAQQEVCRKVAEAKGLDLHWTIEIIGVSGAAVMFSPGMRQLHEIIKSGECDGVVMREVSRLTRPEDFDFAVFQVLKEYGVKVYTESAFYDLSNPNDQMMITFHAGMSGYERTLILNRLQGGKEAKRREGRATPGKSSMPYGVMHDKKAGWSYDPRATARIKLLFDLVASGETNTSALARQTGIAYYTIRRCIVNPIYTGWYVIDKMRDPNVKKTVDAEGRYRYVKIVSRPPELTYRHKVIERGLIDDSVFALVQKMLKVKADRHWKRNVVGPDPFVYRGLLRCGECGALMTTWRRQKNSTTRVHDYYVCVNAKWRKNPKTVCAARRLNRAKLETVLDDEIRNKLADPARLWELMKAKQAEADERADVGARIAELEREIKAVAARKDRLTDLYVEGVKEMSKEKYKRCLAEYTEREEILSRALVATRPLNADVSPEYLAAILTPFSRWDEIEPDEKQRLLRQTLPIFKVAAAKDSPGRGDWRKTEYIVNGLTLEGLDTGNQETRINSGDGMGAHILRHAETPQDIYPPDGLFDPAASRSIYIDLAL